MTLTTIEGGNGIVAQSAKGNATIAECLLRYSRGDQAALFDLGVAYSTGSHGLAADMIEAHKWFNIAAAQGHEDAAWCRADVSDEMTAREIAEAQRRAREWLNSDARRAA